MLDAFQKVRFFHTSSVLEWFGYMDEEASLHVIFPSAYVRRLIYGICGSVPFFNEE